MIAETTLLAVLKGTLTTGGSAWAITLAEGMWMAAAVATLPLLLCGANLRHHSRRLRGKRAEGPP